MNNDQIKYFPLRRGLFIAAMIISIFALFVTPFMVRVLCINLNLNAYKPDLFEVEYYSSAGEYTSFGGFVVSTGERYASDSASIVGDLKFVQSLEQQKQIQGFRAPIMYIPEKLGAWSFIDLFNSYRIVNPYELTLEPLLAATALFSMFWLATIWLFKRSYKPY